MSELISLHVHSLNIHSTNVTIDPSEKRHLDLKPMFTSQKLYLIINVGCEKRWKLEPKKKKKNQIGLTTQHVFEGHSEIVFEQKMNSNQQHDDVERTSWTISFLVMSKKVFKQDTCVAEGKITLEENSGNDDNNNPLEDNENLNTTNTTTTIDYNLPLDSIQSEKLMKRTFSTNTITMTLHLTLLITKTQRPNHPPRLKTPSHPRICSSDAKGEVVVVVPTTRRQSNGCCDGGGDSTATRTNEKEHSVPSPAAVIVVGERNNMGDDEEDDIESIPHEVGTFKLVSYDFTSKDCIHFQYTNPTRERITVWIYTSLDFSFEASQLIFANERIKYYQDHYWLEELTRHENLTQHFNHHLGHSSSLKRKPKFKKVVKHEWMISPTQQQNSQSYSTKDDQDGFNDCVDSMVVWFTCLKFSHRLMREGLMAIEVVLNQHNFEGNIEKKNETMLKHVMHLLMAMDI
nr:unnamed protein product [Naegleria fowleri]